MNSTKIYITLTVEVDKDLLAEIDLSGVERRVEKAIDNNCGDLIIAFDVNASRDEH